MAAPAANEDPSLWQAFREARHLVNALTARERQDARNQGVSRFASNPGHSLVARFLAGRVRIEAATQDGRWQAEVFRPGLAAVPAAASGSRVTYRHTDGIVEWFDNRPEGLEHGFVLPTRDSIAHAGPELRLEVAVVGLRPAAEPGTTDTLRLVDAGGIPVLAYRGLKAWDADGRALPSRMVADDDRMVLAVDDRQAAYPLSIDPCFVAYEAKLPVQTTGTGVGGDSFGSSMALSMDTLLVGSSRANTSAVSDCGRASVFVLENGAWTKQAELAASDPQLYSRFGATVALEGDLAVIGAPEASTSSVTSCGRAYIFRRTGQVWTEEARLTSPSPTAYGNMGMSVAVVGEDVMVIDYQTCRVYRKQGTTWSQAMVLPKNGRSLAVNGGMVMLGAPWEAVNGLTGAGAAYIFERSGSNWVQQGRFTAATPAMWENFATNVAFDGDIAVVSNPSFNVTGQYQGMVWFMTRNGNTWTQEYRRNGATGGAQAGSALAVCGQTVMVSSPGNSLLGQTNGTGYVDVLVRAAGGTWSFKSWKAYLSDPLGAPSNYFGRSMILTPGYALIAGPGARGSADSGGATGAVLGFTGSEATWTNTLRLASGDSLLLGRFGDAVAIVGDRAVVGAPDESTAAAATAGAAYVFTRTGTTWALESRVTAADAAAADAFGCAVSITDDTLAVGANEDDIQPGLSVISNVGSVHVFRRSGSAWTLEQRLQASDPAANDGFGTALDLQGNVLLVGSPMDSTGVNEGQQNRGSVYAFTRTGTTWTQKQKFDGLDTWENNSFGSAVAMDGTTAVIGAPGAIANTYTLAGKAYVFTYNGSTWSQQAMMTSPTPAYNERFGTSVGINGSTVVVGAPGADLGTVVDAGKAFVFTRTGTAWSLQQALADPAAAANDALGKAVAVYGDLAVAGAYRSDVGSLANCGSISLFHRQGTTWTHRARFTPAEAHADDAFGASLALEGTSIIGGAGAHDHVDPPNGLVYDQGGAYSFRVTTAPTLAVIGPDGATIADEFNDSQFGGLTVGGAATRTFTVTNSGTQTIESLGVAVEGPQADTFTAVGWQAAALAPQQSRELVVRFQPTALVRHQATLRLASNVSADGTFDINLTGDGITAAAAYQQWAASLPDPAPDATPFHDGVPNLLKYAFRMENSGPDRTTLTPGSGTSGLPAWGWQPGAAGGMVVRLEYVRRQGNGMGYLPQYSTTLRPGSFVPMTGTTTISGIEPGWERVVVEQPVAPATTPVFFGRLEVTLP